jgi:hypothetical protein
MLFEHEHLTCNERVTRSIRVIGSNKKVFTKYFFPILKYQLNARYMGVEDIQNGISYSKIF